MKTFNIISLILALAISQFNLKAQSGFDFQKMKEKYERRQPSLDTMSAYPSMKYKEVQATTDDGITIAGWFIPGKRKAGTILMVHGFNMNKSHMLSRAALFSAMGKSVLLIDLRARGESGGEKTSPGNDSSSDILATANFYQRQFKKYGELTLYGFSHGGRAVMYTAGHMDSKTKVILESPPYSMTNSFKRTYGMPNAPNMDDGSLDKALQAMSNNPLLLMIGDNDSAIIESEAKTVLAFSKNSQSQMKVFSKTEHNVMTKENKAEFIKLITLFLEN
jgi:dienelactone hydrolase